MIHIKNIYELFGDDVRNATGLYAEDLAEQYKDLDFNPQVLIDYFEQSMSFGDLNEKRNLFCAVMKQMGYDPNDKEQLFEGLKELYDIYTYNIAGAGTNGFVNNRDALNFFEANKEAIINWAEEEASQLGCKNSGEFVLKYLANDFNALEDMLTNDGYQTKQILARAVAETVAFRVMEENLKDIEGFVDEYELDKSLQELATQEDNEKNINVRTNR